MSTLTFACPQCQFTAQVQAAFSGREVACPGCKRPVRVGAQAPASAQSPQAQASRAQPATIGFACPNCGHPSRVAARHAGQQAKCGACKHMIVVPAGAPQQPAAPSLAQPSARPPALAPAQPVAPQAAPGLVVFDCPSCGTRSQVDSVYSGQQGQCASCKGLFVIPFQSAAAAPAQQSAPALAMAPAAAATPSLALAPAAVTAPTPAVAAASPIPSLPSGGLELELAPEPEPTFVEPDPEPEYEEPEPGRRRGRKSKRGGQRRGGGRPRQRSRGRGSVRVFEALASGAVDFKDNALLCLVSLVVVELCTIVVAVIVGLGAGVIAGLAANLPGLVVAVLGAVTLTLVVSAYLLQGLFAVWLACARGEEVSLTLLFSPPFSGGLSGAMVQVAVSIAYFGLCLGLAYFMNTVASIPGFVVGGVLFFAICCLLVLICGLAQVYIVDQELDFADALAAASGAVSSFKAQLLGYAAVCVGAVFLVTLVVAFMLSATGISPDPLNPELGKIVLSFMIQAGVSLSLLSIMGTSLSHIYLQLSGR